MVQNIFMCHVCRAVVMAEADEIGCVPCKQNMEVIGFQETAAPKRRGKERVVAANSPTR